MSSSTENKSKKEVPQGYPRGHGIEWLSKRSFRLGGYNFDIPAAIMELGIVTRSANADSFHLGKTPDLLSRYLRRVANRKYNNILELGVYQGGSTALIQLIAKPERLLALELSPERVEILDRFIEAEGLTKSLKVEYGVDQANGPLVRQLATQHLGEGRCIDLVLDDASHLLSPTRTSFETLFPLLRPGGSYIIEDYAYLQIQLSEYLESALAGSSSARIILNTIKLDELLRSGDRPCHLLAIEAMLTSINSPGLVKKVVVDRHWLEIVRGTEDFEYPNAFNLRKLAMDQFSLLESTPSEKLLSFLK